MFWRSMSTDLLPGPAQELVHATSRPRRELVAGYWRDLLELSPAELVDWSDRRLSRLRDRGTPYLVVAGREPGVEYGRWLGQHLPQAEVTVIPGGGHFPHLVHPRLFAESLAAFAPARHVDPRPRRLSLA